MSNNNMAGIADPYWYEWSVGLLYALDMLNPDNNIRHVILQSKDMQGLDDIVIEYRNGSAHCIQIKHTREGNTLTFSDMILKSDGKKSLLDSMCRDWKNSFKLGYLRCRAVLFTNRKAGIRNSSKVEDNDNKYLRPALKIFIKHIIRQLDNVSSISEINIPKEWEKAWSEWLGEMDCLENDEKKLLFLKSFDLMTDQEELEIIIDEISRKLSDHFHINNRVSVQLDQKLCYALRTWTTTTRKKQEITREDLFEALSLAGDKIYGEHDLKVCEPFFSSRLEFVKDLESILLSREVPVVFLHGDPGSGKTNIVSHMVNKNDSVITLRFYAFKPLSAEDLYLSADKGISDPRALWGNLLIELRELFSGKIAENNIPVSIELIDSIDELRKEVLRLAQQYSIETGKPTIIAIDGIDHAARSGSKNSFLPTLVNPDGIPDNVCFLISGQPVNQYEMYPDWLASNNGVLHIEVPSIKSDDIKQLFLHVNKLMPKEDVDIAVKIINNAVSGNTLSAVFAVNVSSDCSTIEELEKEIEGSRISSGLLSYYEYMWKSTLENLPQGALFLESLMAGALTQINKKITPLFLASVFKRENISEYVWKSSLNRLYPLVVNENGEYRIFHNDFRIYLDKYLKKDHDSFVEVSNRLADYFMNHGDDIQLKHELIYQLLINADREREFINVYTEDYIIEAIKHKRSMQELYDQLELTALSLRDTGVNESILSFSCALDTLFQYQASLQWEDKHHEEDFELPMALMSEKKVKNKELFDDKVIDNMLNDALLLLNYNDIERASKLVFRWLEGFSPESLAVLILKNIEKPEQVDKALETSKKNTIRELLEKWGLVSRTIGINFERLNQENASNDDLEYRAYFAIGWFKKSVEYKSIEELKYTFTNVDSFYRIDVDNLLCEILEYNDINSIKWLIDNNIFDDASNVTHIKLVSWSIITRNDGLVEKWSNMIIEKKFDYIEDVYEKSYNSESFEIIALLVFVLFYFDKMDKYSINDIVQKGLYKYRGKKFTFNDRGYYTANKMLKASCYLGYIYLHFSDDTFESISEDKFIEFISLVFNKKESLEFYEIGGPRVQKFLLTSIISCDYLLSNKFKELLIDQMIENVKSLDTITNFDIWWDYLEKNNRTDSLREVFNKWMGEGGIIWSKELSDIHVVYDVIMPKAEKLAWRSDIKIINDKLKFKIIGYVGNKEYSLYLPLKWYNSLDHINNNYWTMVGLKLLNISEYALNTGDNRAYIYILAAVSESAGTRSATDLGQFSMCNEHWDKGWIQTIFDGLIASFKTKCFTEEELLHIWNTATKFFYMSEYPMSYDSDYEIRKAYISDIKNGIKQAAQRLKFCNIDEKMENMAPIEFLQDRTNETLSAIRVPDRWYHNGLSKSATDYQEIISDMNSIEAIDYLKSQYINNPESFSWDNVVGFVNLFEKRKDDLDPDCIEEILNLIIYERKGYSWRYDGVDRAIEAIFPFLNLDQYNLLLANIIERYSKDSLYGSVSRFHILKEDLNSFIFFYYKTLGDSTFLGGLIRILDMHMNWVTGYGILDFPTYYSESKINFNNLNWIEFCELIKDKYHAKF